MNYFAHGCRFIDSPYFLAGTAVPDWLNVVDRRVRARAKRAEPLVGDSDARVAALAAGIVQHHRDDAWFHETTAFYELSTAFTQAIRAVTPNDEGFRPSFLGHILVEILLDAELIAADPARLEAYYQAFEHIEPELVAEVVGRIAARSVPRLALLIPRFSTERFLSDYGEDAKLFMRLNQVMRRVNLPPLPEAILRVFPELRAQVGERKDELLSPRTEKTL